MTRVEDRGALPHASAPSSRSFSIWLVKDGEPLPIDPAPHLLRTGSLAAHLAARGCDVTWWTSDFDHGRKARRRVPSVVSVAANYQLQLLHGPAYRRNLSLNRIRNYRACARDFAKRAAGLRRPDVILAAYPSPELCEAARRVARRYDVPFVVDMRDPWPDNVPGFFPAVAQPVLWPVLALYRRRLQRIVDDADGLVAMSRAMLDWAVAYRRHGQASGDRVIRIGGAVPASVRRLETPRQFSEDQPLRCTFLSSGGVSSDAATVIAAAQILEARGERRVHITITGSRHTASEAAAIGPGSLTFTGWLTHAEIEPLLARSHVGLVQICGDVARFWLGNKLFDYLSASLAVINNVSGEPAEIVERQGFGVTIPAKSPDALADAISAFVDDPDRLRACMENARHALVSEFDRAKLHDEFMGYLQSHARRG